MTPVFGSTEAGLGGPGRMTAGFFTVVLISAVLASCGRPRKPDEVDNSGDVSPRPSSMSQPGLAFPPPPARINQKLAKIIADFHSELTAYNVVIPTPKIELRVAEFAAKEDYVSLDFETTLGFCRSPANGSASQVAEIYLKSPEARFGKPWDKLERSEYYSIVGTVYHELAHCLLKLGHLEDFGIDGDDGKYIMSRFSLVNERHADAKSYEHSVEAQRLSYLFVREGEKSMTDSVAVTMGEAFAKRLASKMASARKVEATLSADQMGEMVKGWILEELVGTKTEDDLAKEKLGEMMRELLTVQLAKIRLKEFP